MGADSRTYSICLGITCMLGSILSAYALLVELSAELHPDQPAMCDLSEHMSCSRVLTSRLADKWFILNYDVLLSFSNIEAYKYT